VAEQIKVEGLTQFIKALRDTDREIPKALRKAFNVAAQIVVDYAQARVPVRTGAARRSIVARSSQSAVRVACGGQRAPYFPWLDFGGRVGRHKSVARPFLKDGRYVYQALYTQSDAIRDATTAALVDAARAAGLQVSGD